MKSVTQTIISITCMLIIMAGYHHKFATSQIVQVDINHIIEEKVKALSKNNLTEVENKQAIQTFGKTLEKTIHQIAKSKNLIILPSQAVISGSQDITESIQRRLNR